ncbi:CinA family protein [Aureimonas frigidaquae]|uniref:Competence/damage-inducible protein CinA n=1 Tax=Aureimonas frigidaquae TaxID=424757 RepID=A0A0P0Z3P6_9HYPH|nr:CinA family protein [Aureimonas frigidaquae]BAT28432.1 competence/damage-inducible protein CinA [Aureimonas frigidaquae]
MRDDEGLIEEAERLIRQATELGIKLATAESCTGGLVAAYLTEIAGSSAVVDRGFVTYSNAAKHELLGVPMTGLESFGAVSEEVAKAMALGALVASRADIAVSITGIAGPGGGSAEKPVGLVHFGAARGDTVLHRREHFGDIGRRRVRLMSVAIAFDLLDALMRR